jgi:hypothetical protein
MSTDSLWLRPCCRCAIISHTTMRQYLVKAAPSTGPYFDKTSHLSLCSFWFRVKGLRLPEGLQAPGTQGCRIRCTPDPRFYEQNGNQPAAPEIHIISKHCIKFATAPIVYILYSGSTGRPLFSEFRVDVRAIHFTCPPSVMMTELMDSPRYMT